MLVEGESKYGIPMTKAARKRKPAASPVSVWATEPDALQYREDTHTYAGLTFKVTRRSLTFPEESKLLAKCFDQVNKRVDWLEFLAGLVALTVKETDFELTAERVRKELPQRPALAWFLIKWLCYETMANVDPEAVEGLRKKPGP